MEVGLHQPHAAFQVLVGAVRVGVAHDLLDTLQGRRDGRVVSPVLQPVVLVAEARPVGYALPRLRGALVDEHGEEEQVGDVMEGSFREVLVRVQQEGSQGVVRHAGRLQQGFDERTDVGEHRPRFAEAVLHLHGGVEHRLSVLGARLVQHLQEQRGAAAYASRIVEAVDE